MSTYTRLGHALRMNNEAMRRTKIYNTSIITYRVKWLSEESIVRGSQRTLNSSIVGKIKIDCIRWHRCACFWERGPSIRSLQSNADNGNRRVGIVLKWMCNLVVCGLPMLITLAIIILFTTGLVRPVENLFID